MLYCLTRILLAADLEASGFLFTSDPEISGHRAPDGVRMVWLGLVAGKWGCAGGRRRKRF